MCFFFALLVGPKFPLTGTYKVAMIQPGAKVAVAQPANTPVGAVRHVVIENDRWMLFDMMSAFYGPLKVSGQVVTFTATGGPAGKLKKPDLIFFDLGKDGRTLTQRPHRPKDARLVLTWTSPKLLVKPLR